MKYEGFSSKYDARAFLRYPLLPFSQVLLDVLDQYIKRVNISWNWLINGCTFQLIDLSNVHKCQRWNKPTADIYFLKINIYKTEVCY